MGTTLPPLADPAEVTRLLHRITELCGADSSRWYSPDGYRSVALALLDSIYSTGNKYTGVTNFLNGYVMLRGQEGANAYDDTPTDLINTIDRWGGVDEFVAKVGYRWRTSTTPGAPYKAQATLEAAQALASGELETRPAVQDRFRERAARLTDPVAKRWLKIPGQSSGLTWNYFLMLCGLPGVKADRMVTRFTGDAVGRAVGQSEASALVEAVCDRQGWNYTMVDHTLWRFQSGRPHRRDIVS